MLSTPNNRKLKLYSGVILRSKSESSEVSLKRIAVSSLSQGNRLIYNKSVSVLFFILLLFQQQ